MKNFLPTVALLIGSLILSSCGNTTHSQPITWGKANAPITITAYLDFQCPACKQFFEENMNFLKKEFLDTGKASFRFMDFPGRTNSQSAHLAFHCAEEQGEGWGMAHLLFSTQGQNILPLYSIHAKTLGLDVESFEQCLAEERYLNLISANRDQGREEGLSETPWIHANGTRIPGLGGYEQVRKVLGEIGEEL